MASTTFVDQQTTIVAEWLNDVNTATYTTVPALSSSLTTLSGTTLPNGYVAKTSATGAAAVPVGTTAQRPTGVQGYYRYNTTLAKWEGFDGTSWGSLGGGATGGGTDTIFQTNTTTMTTSYTLPTGVNASTVGPITINTGVVLTVPTGQRLVVL